jgi:hypothetical protein
MNYRPKLNDIEKRIVAVTRHANATIEPVGETAAA